MLTLECQNQHKIFVVLDQSHVSLLATGESAEICVQKESGCGALPSEHRM